MRVHLKGPKKYGDIPPSPNLPLPFGISVLPKLLLFYPPWKSQPGVDRQKRRVTSNSQPN